MEKEEAERTEQNECNDNENFLQPKTKPKKKKNPPKNQHNYPTRSLSLLLSFVPSRFFVCLSVLHKDLSRYLPRYYVPYLTLPLVGKYLM